MLPKFESFFAKENLKGTRVLEIGRGDSVEFKNYFEEKGALFDSIDRKEGEYWEDIHRADNFYNFVFSSHCFEHVSHPLLCLREAKRVLKTGGKLLIVTPFHCRHQVLEGDPEHLFVFTDLQMAKLLNFSGFKNVSCVVHADSEREQDYNLFSTGEKK